MLLYEIGLLKENKMIRAISNLRSKFQNRPMVEKFTYYSIVAALFMYVFSIPSFANRVGLNFICYVLMALLTGLIIFHSFVFGLKKQFDKRTLLIVIFVVTALVGTVSYSLQFRGLLTLVLLSISMFVIYIAMLIVNNTKLLFATFIMAFFVFAIYFIAYYRNEILNYASYNYDEFRIGWEFENPNTIGTFMTLGISLSAYVVLFKDGKWRFIYVVPAGTFLLVGLTTGSRTFLISIFILAIAFLLFKFKKHIFVALFAIISIVAIAIILINTLPFLATIKYRIDDTLKIFDSGVASGSTLERVLWQKYGFYLASRRIFFGFGESGFAFASGVKTYTHGNFTEMLCDFGIIGFLLFYAFNIGPAFISFLTNKKDREYVITILIVMLVNGFLTVYYYDKSTYVIMAFCYYLLDNAQPKINQKENIVLDLYCEVNI